MDDYPALVEARRYAEQLATEIQATFDRAWFHQPKPRRWHRCTAAVDAMTPGGLVERCACGGIRLDGYGPWMERNSRGRS